MKKICLILIIFILVCAGYVSVNCLFKIPERHIVIAQDQKNGSIFFLKPGYNFVWQALIPQKIIIRNYNIKNEDIFNLKINNPVFSDSESRYKFIRLDMSIEYELIFDNFNFTDLTIKQNQNIFHDLIYNNLQTVINKEIIPYFIHGYRSSLILKDEKNIVGRAVENIKSLVNNKGIKIINYKTIGGFEIPDDDAYNKELSYQNELNELEKNNKKELIIIQSKLQKEKILNIDYYNKLNEISKIIKENPDMLKYIYIDKMSDNVKVIITSDKSGMPFGLNLNDEASSVRYGEIDNLLK